VHWLDPVTAALDAAPAPVDVFFRDDDAGWATDRLLALLDRFAPHELPLDLAVIAAVGRFGVTVSVAEWLVTEPAALDTTTRKRAPSSDSWAPASV
jgi:hypothetical protein